jgi:secreted trypsin-like serine protease
MFYITRQSAVETGLLLLFLTLSLSSSVTFGQSSTGEENRIANGTLATSGQFPYYVAVTVNEQHKCGGFLYNDRFVITAASCIADPPGYAYTIPHTLSHFISKSFRKRIKDVIHILQSASN